MRQWFGQRRRFTKAIPWIATAAALHVLVAAERAYVHARWGRRGVDLAWSIIGIFGPIETLALWLSGFSLAFIGVSATGLVPHMTLRVTRRIRALVELDFAHPLLVETVAAASVFLLLAWRYGLLFRGPASFFGCLGASLLAFLSVRRRLVPLLLHRARKRLTAANAGGLPIHAKALPVTPGAHLFLAASALASVLAGWLAYSTRSDHLHDGLGLSILLLYLSFVGGGTLLARHASSVVIGADGLVLRGVGRSRFVAFRDVDHINLGGEDIVVRSPSRSLRFQLDPWARAHLAQVTGRIRDALTNARASSRAAVLLEHLRIVGSEQAEPSAVARALTAPRGYREVAVRSEDLWAVVEGSAADARARLSAAIALARTVHPVEEPRLRRAALFCVEPGLTAEMARVALRDATAAG